jgi:hypothetical protein
LPDDEKNAADNTKIRPEILSHLKESVRKNRKLGELLAK